MRRSGPRARSPRDRGSSPARSANPNRARGRSAAFPPGRQAKCPGAPPRHALWGRSTPARRRRSADIPGALRRPSARRAQARRRPFPRRRAPSGCRRRWRARELAGGLSGRRRADEARSTRPAPNSPRSKARPRWRGGLLQESLAPHGGDRGFDGHIRRACVPLR